MHTTDRNLHVIPPTSLDTLCTITTNEKYAAISETRVWELGYWLITIVMNRIIYRTKYYCWRPALRCLCVFWTRLVSIWNSKREVIDQCGPWGSLFNIILELWQPQAYLWIVSYQIISVWLCQTYPSTSWCALWNTWTTTVVVYSAARWQIAVATLLHRRFYIDE